jgi:flagellar biosynthesis/type III secretory pathway protein FliH
MEVDIIKDSISRYSADFESVRDDIVSGIKEGFEEGLKEGIKKGFCDGIKDYFSNNGNVEIKSLEKILKDAFENASEKSIRSTIKKIVIRKYKTIVDPSFKKYLEKACNRAVEEIRNSKVQIDGSRAKNAKDLLAKLTEEISKKVGEISSKFREKFPTDIVFGSAVDGIREGFEETFNENIKKCEERIGNEIDNKVTYVSI